AGPASPTRWSVRSSTSRPTPPPTSRATRSSSTAARSPDGPDSRGAGLPPANRQHGARRQLDHAHRHAPNEEPRDRAPAVGADHDEVRAPGPRRPHDLEKRDALDEDR